MTSLFLKGQGEGLPLVSLPKGMEVVGGQQLSESGGFPPIPTPPPKKKGIFEILTNIKSKAGGECIMDSNLAKGNPGQPILAVLNIYFPISGLLLE